MKSFPDLALVIRQRRPQRQPRCVHLVAEGIHELPAHRHATGESGSSQEIEVPADAKEATVLEVASRHLAGTTIRKAIYAKGRIVNFVVG